MSWVLLFVAYAVDCQNVAPSVRFDTVFGIVELVVAGPVVWVDQIEL